MAEGGVLAVFRVAQNGLQKDIPVGRRLGKSIQVLSQRKSQFIQLSSRFLACSAFFSGISSSHFATQAPESINRPEDEIRPLKRVFSPGRSELI
jgi:hypothetical protein